MSKGNHVFISSVYMYVGGCLCHGMRVDVGSFHQVDHED